MEGRRLQRASLKEGIRRRLRPLSRAPLILAGAVLFTAPLVPVANAVAAGGFNPVTTYNDGWDCSRITLHSMPNTYAQCVACYGGDTNRTGSTFYINGSPDNGIPMYGPGSDKQDVGGYCVAHPAASDGLPGGRIRGTVPAATNNGSTRLNNSIDALAALTATVQEREAEEAAEQQRQAALQQQQRQYEAEQLAALEVERDREVARAKAIDDARRQSLANPWDANARPAAPDPSNPFSSNYRDPASSSDNPFSNNAGRPTEVASASTSSPSGGNPFSRSSANDSGIPADLSQLPQGNANANANWRKRNPDNNGVTSKDGVNGLPKYTGCTYRSARSNSDRSITAVLDCDNSNPIFGEGEHTVLLGLQPDGAMEYMRQISNGN